MTWKSRLLLRESVFTSIAFTLAVYFYYLIAVWGVQDHFIDGYMRDYLNSRAVHAELLLSGILFGGLIGIINRITETPKLRSRPVGQVVLFRTLLYLVSIAAVVALVMLVFATLILPWEDLRRLFQTMNTRYTLSFAAYMAVVVVAINFALEIGRVLGPEHLWRLFLGSYRRPRVEQRIFLFMDLKGSTTIAEELGHQRYSELLQECYMDLTPVVMQYEAAIYQYVGDEIVMSWRCSDEQERRRAGVQAFFAFRRAHMEKKEKYERRFGMMPEFKGGIDAGPVTVIEVGDVKREIVYHGDVLNTAARLLELCKTRGEELIVSQSVGEAVEKIAEVRASWCEEVSLRGKREPVEAYCLQPADS